MSKIIESKLRGKKFDESKDVADLTEEIRNNEDSVETLKLDGNSYGIEPLKEIGRSLQTCHNLRHLLLNDMFTSRLKDEIPESLRYLFGGIQQSQAKILTLNLDDNAIGPVTMPALLPFLESEQLTHLRALHLNNCGLGIKGGTMLSNALSRFDKLDTLIIGRNRLEKEGIIQISSALSKINGLQRLELPQNGTKEAAIIKLCESLKQHPNLRIFNLNDNVLTTTVNELASVLKTLHQLEVLNLGDCLLKTNGAITVLSALESMIRNKGTTHLDILNLSGNEIGSNAKDILIKTIETIIETRVNNQVKFQIDLSGNNFGEETVEQLKNHFDTIIDLIIDDDQGPDDECEADNEYDDDDHHQNESEELVKNNTDETIDEHLLMDAEALHKYLNEKYDDADSLCRRFFTLATSGFNRKDKSIDKNAIIEMNALIKIGQQKFLKNETDYDLINKLLVACGLIKSEDIRKSPSKESDLSGPILALARISKEFNDVNQKRCIKNLILDKMNDIRYESIKNEIYSLIYSF